MAGHVYLIGSRKFHWFKIGKSARATIRISELGILIPFRIEVIAIWKADSHHKLERDLHEKYSGYIINGEWFSFNPEQLNCVISEMLYASTEINSKFCNFAADVVPSGAIKAARKVLPQPEHAGVHKRIARLTKTIYCLEEELKIARANKSSAKSADIALITNSSI